MQGTLIAKLDGETQRCRVESIGSNTLSLTIAAINNLLKLALHSRIWARGAIELRDNTGKVLQTMAAKK